jgi:hypothetical protein
MSIVDFGMILLFLGGLATFIYQAYKNKQMTQTMLLPLAAVFISISYFLFTYFDLRIIFNPF